MKPYFSEPISLDQEAMAMKFLNILNKGTPDDLWEILSEYDKFYLAGREKATELLKGDITLNSRELLYQKLKKDYSEVLHKPLLGNTVYYSHYGSMDIVSVLVKKNANDDVRYLWMDSNEMIPIHMTYGTRREDGYWIGFLKVFTLSGLSDYL